MKKMSPIAYRALFFKHVWRFLGNVASQKELQGSHAVAVSGGLDSMTLLWVAKMLHQQGKIGKVRAIFVHHNTRSGQNDEESLIKKYCERENIPFVTLHVTGLKSGDSNFEARARKLRRSLCLTEVHKEELLWMGHHLDDSYEWNFMQRHRSTTPKSSLGIPVRNHCIIRPFLCVTKLQLKKLARFEGIPFMDDPTNDDLKYNRNYIRHKIIPLIKARYPKYLKFYSHFANFSSIKLNVNIMHKSRSARIFSFQDGVAMLGKHFSEIQIQEIIHAYSSADRGKIITPIERMLRAINNGKKGPFQFSGGMEAYHSHGLLIFYRQGMKNYDQAVASVLKQLSVDLLANMSSYKKVELEHAWQNLLHSPDALMNLPGLVLVMESESICKTLNTSVFDSRFPEVSAVCQEKGLRFMTFQKCLDVWMQKKEKLPERLRLVPLSHLSNLFASQ